MNSFRLGRRMLATPRPSSRYHLVCETPRPLARLALAVILSFMTLQITFLLVGCDWELSGDEAEYWTWSRRLDWSYFAKGPLIAWLIRGSTMLLGGWSERLCGSPMLAVRVPAVLLGGTTAWGVYRLAEATIRTSHVALIAVLLLPVIPIFALGGVLMTIDTPLVAAWTWAAVWSWRGIDRDRFSCWILAGLVGCLGVWAKYTMVAFPVAVGTFLLLDSDRRHLLIRRGFWGMTLLCVGLGMAPILYWNMHNGWVAAGQLADRVGLTPRTNRSGPLVLLGFLAGEVVAVGVVWWCLGWSEIVRTLRGAITDRSRVEVSGPLYLVCLWGIVWTACVAAALLGESEVNWMAPGYVGFVILAARGIEMSFRRGVWPKRAIVACWGMGLLLTATLHHTEHIYPWIARFVPAPTRKDPVPLRLFDPTTRMRGHRQLAEALDLSVAQLRAAGENPFVVSPTYTTAATLSFFMKGQPEVYCLAWSYGMGPNPLNQHDLWHPNPRNDPEAFLGRPAVVVEEAKEPPSHAHLMVGKHVYGSKGAETRVIATRSGLAVAAWDVTICRDYRGLKSFVPNRPQP